MALGLTLLQPLVVRLALPVAVREGEREPLALALPLLLLLAQAVEDAHREGEEEGVELSEALLQAEAEVEGLWEAVTLLQAVAVILGLTLALVVLEPEVLPLMLALPLPLALQGGEGEGDRVTLVDVDGHAVGKAHWEVFNDEGRSTDELVTTSLRNQTEAAGDFDIEWGRDPGAHPWQIKKLADFRAWLINNRFDPEDRSLTIGHPKVAQVNLPKSFGTLDYNQIWQKIATRLDVYKIRTSDAEATYEYRWSDKDYAEQQIRRLT
jgi:hypothetical protein